MTVGELKRYLAHYSEDSLVLIESFDQEKQEWVFLPPDIKEQEIIYNEFYCNGHEYKLSSEINFGDTLISSLVIS
jgi:hypothetical protein